MTAILLLLLPESWPVAYAQGLLAELHTYDVLRCEVALEAREDGVEVSCGLTLRILRAGPVRLLLSADVDRLEARGAAASLAGASFGKVLEAVAPGVRGVPALLTLEPEPPPAAGAVVTIPLRYRWRPKGNGFAYAGRDRLQTHLAPFWLPSMADERFDADVTVRTGALVLAPGAREEVPGGWRFRAEGLQTVPVVVGAFHAFPRGKFEVLLPDGVDAEPDALLDDLALVFDRLEAWYGPAPGAAFRLAVEPRPAPASSYCTASFAVVDRRFLPGAAGRARWVSHLAHECAHVWWGHAVASPVVGGGGTWLREGLAEWSGCEVAGELLGSEVRDALHREDFRRYFRRLDLRRADGGALFANEPTLLDATYLDDPAVPYLRGALVHRALAHRLGRDAFLQRLAAFRRSAGDRFATAADYARALGEEEAVAYYALTTRLPDFEIAEVDAAAGSAVVRCRDPLWPGGVVPCRVVVDGEARTIPVEVRDGSGTLRWTGRAARIEVDPERVTLDPVRSNNVWAG